jgi:hypothetical protein
MLNGEEKRDITFFGRTFNYKPSGANTGIHELAKELASLDGNVSYPTTIILNSNLEINLQISDYISGKNMLLILKKF